MINKAIGASGVVSQQCKTVVDQYGQTILDLLLAEVRILLIYMILDTERNESYMLFFLLYMQLFCFFQTQPKKICSQIGLCAYDGTHGVR